MVGPGQEGNRIAVQSEATLCSHFLSGLLCKTCDLLGKVAETML